MSEAFSRNNPLVAVAVVLLCCSPLLVPAAGRTWHVLTSPTPAASPVPDYEAARLKANVPKYSEAELEFLELPSSMCWARVKGKPGAWSYGVQRKDGAWLLLPCHFHPTTEEAKLPEQELSRGR